MNPQQMAMELRVLRAEKVKLVQMLENMRAQGEKDKAIEGFIAHAIAGYASQPRAASDDFWEKDQVTGTMVPKQGGPKWVAEMALKTMNYIVMELEDMVAANAPTQEKESAEESTEEPQGLYLDPALFDAGSEEKAADSN